MTHQPKLVELASRCEAATGPNRELDADIAAAVHMKQLTYSSPEWIKDPEFTTSLDAAMTLVDEGMAKRGYYFTLEHDPFDRAGRPWAARFDTAGDECGHGDTIYAAAATPALALCAASLRAMEERNA